MCTAGEDWPHNPVSGRAAPWASGNRVIGFSGPLEEREMAAGGEGRGVQAGSREGEKGWERRRER